MGGLQGTAQNLGSSLGVALAGTVLFLGLATTFTSSVLSNDNIDAAAQQGVADAAASGVQIVTLTQAQEALTNAGALGERRGRNRAGVLRQQTSIIASRARHSVHYWLDRDTPDAWLA